MQKKSITFVAVGGNSEMIFPRNYRQQATHDRGFAQSRVKRAIHDRGFEENSCGEQPTTVVLHKVE